MVEQFDVVIVGAGSAGCVVAARLSEDRNVRVLLLEAGGSDRSPMIRIPAGLKWLDAKYDWCIKGEPDPSRDGFVDTWAGGKVLGGSGSINAMQWARGHRSDFDEWASLGCDGWDYESVLPLFRRSERFDGGGDDRYRGRAGPLHVSLMRVSHHLTDAFIDAATQAGHAYNPDYNGAELKGVGRGQLSQRRGWRDSTARAFLARARRRRNLVVRSRAEVRRVIIDGNRAVGVEYDRGDRRSRVRARQEVVLCAGTTMSPKLLMLSGVGPAEELRSLDIDIVADRAEVGRNLHEHPYGAMSYAVNVRTLNQELTPRFVIQHGLDFLVRGRGPVTSTAGHALVWGSFDSDDRPDYQVIFAPFGFRNKSAAAGGDDEGATAYQQLARRRERYHHDIHDMQLAKTSSVTAYPSVLHPRSRGVVTLRSADPADPPVIRHQLIGDPRDLDALIEACRAVRKIFAAPALEPFVVGEELPGPCVETDHDWAEYLTGFSFRGNHPVGTCRMGADADSVVDPQLRVRGIDGLRVIDASIMPTVTSAPTNAPTVMIAEKGAALVRSELQSHVSTTTSIRDAG